MLSENAVALYLHVSTRSGWSIEDASSSLGLRIQDVEAARDELLERRLLAPLHADGGPLVSAAPDVALAELVDADERRVLELQSAIARRRGELMALVPAYREARRALGDADLVEVVEDPATVLRLLLDLGASAAQEVLIAQPGRATSVERHEESDDTDRELLARGVARRTLYHDGRRDHVATRRTVEHLTPLGAEFRTVPLVPFRLVVIDRSLAVMSRARDEADRAALVVRSPEVAATLARAFDAAWAFAVPLVPEEQEDPAALTALHRSIVSGLAAGLTDEVLATRVGVSVRTLRRHIASLFEALGAESRFQAGVLAAQRGWLSAQTR